MNGSTKKSEKIKKYMETNENESTAVKIFGKQQTFLRRKFIAIQA